MSETNLLIATALDRNYSHARDELRNYLIKLQVMFPIDPPLNNHTRYLARQLTTARRAVRAFEQRNGMYKVDSAHLLIAWNHKEHASV